MIKGVTHVHLGSIQYQSEPLETPIAQTIFLVWTFLPFLTAKRLQARWCVLVVYFSILFVSICRSYSLKLIISVFLSSMYFCCMSRKLKQPPITHETRHDGVLMVFSILFISDDYCLRALFSAHSRFIVIKELWNFKWEN